MTTAGDILAVARKLLDDSTRYVLGAEVGLTSINFDMVELNIDGIAPLVKADCSEFTQAVAWYCGLSGFPDGAYLQAAYCRRRGTSITVAEALATPGALLFVDYGASGGNGHGNHVGISDGTGWSWEARSSRLTPNCGRFKATGRGWNYAAKYPDVAYGIELAPPIPPKPIEPPAAPAILFAGHSIGVNVPLDSGPFRLILQDDANLVLHDRRTGPLWASNTAGSGADSLAMQGDGNLVLYAGAAPVGASMTVGYPGAYLAVQSDGNAVIYTPGGQPVWASKSSPWIPIG